MAVFQKNDPDQASTLAPHFDGALDEQCNEYSECSSFRPYLSAGKPVLNAEYQASLYPGFCSADNAAGIMGALYSLNLDGSTYQPCWSTTGSPPGQRSAPVWTERILSSGSPRAGLTLKRGAVQVRVACPRGQSYCDGTVEVDTVRRFAVHAHGRRPLVLGTRKVHIVGGHSALVGVKLSRRALGRLGRTRTLSVVVWVRARDAAGRRASSHRTVTLVLRGVG